MKRLAYGFIAGLFVGLAATTQAASVLGDNGYLLGWTVVRNGEEICSQPFVWKVTREIECD